MQGGSKRACVSPMEWHGMVQMCNMFIIFWSEKKAPLLEGKGALNPEIL